MNFKGEILCALTMLYPSYQSIVVLIKVYPQNLSVFDKLIIAQCLIHLPFSVALHVSRAMGDCCHKGRGLIMRRLDYTFIFISNILLAFGLSHSVLYGLISLICNTRLMYLIWTQSFYIYYPPVNEVSFGVFIYILGLVVNNRILDFYKSVVIGVFTYFCTYFDTIGFAVMHIYCGFLQHVFLSHLR